MADHTTGPSPASGAQTTGHVWDDDLQEFNNPLPAWWTYGFYVTILFALVYWVWYPSWPVGAGFMTGIGKVTYVNAQGEEESWHWNTRAKLLAETQEASALQKPYFDRIASLPYEQVTQDPELNSFVVSAGKALFSENCAACHQAGGQGKIGFFPNLTDDDWLYGGSFERIHASIAQGRRGYMPPYGEALNAARIDELAHYVLSLSGAAQVDAAKVAQGKELFNSHAGACYYCHGDNGKGRQDIGSANLTDQVWLWANVPAAEGDAAKLDAVRKVIASGLDKGVMPAWQGRLSAEQIRLLTLYVHELGGGK
ncbi:MAG: cytochrome c oxidase cbb3-type subunit III [bacterium]|nr:MAG: cytochrome c oxidase cbb3-type subunit III [bacterium]KAF0147876.1 MAG: cytochrome c oxidase cbb3-type subunit III [bacterium]KAF0167477.1 MAG: cytochrome c oxidase cbb3-type subunit III [bacterium]TXT20987.1 MAG: cytochrome c oxidase cbb3-type subunit III [bacterium]